MPALIYLHGFLSSPESAKATILKSWLSENRPDIEYCCPQLSAYSDETKFCLNNIVENYADAIPMVVGSSLGGYWATWLSESYDLPAVLINPAVKPSIFLPGYVGVELENYYTEERYILRQKDVDDLREVDTPYIKRVENYWLLAQTDDDTLDYRLSVQKYSGCRQLVEEGGNHSFENFERWLPEILNFLEQRRDQLLR